MSLGFVRAFRSHIGSTIPLQREARRGGGSPPGHLCEALRIWVEVVFLLSGFVVLRRLVCPCRSRGSLCACLSPKCPIVGLLVAQRLRFRGRNCWGRDLSAGLSFGFRPISVAAGIKGGYFLHAVSHEVCLGFPSVELAAPAFPFDQVFAVTFRPSTV